MYADSAGIAAVAGEVNGCAQPKITSVGTLTGLSVSGTSGFNNIGSSGSISATGNVTGGNIRTVGSISATSNIAGNYFIGDGSQLTGITGPIFMAYNSTPQGISTGSSTMNLVYSTTTVNTGTYYNTTTGIFTPGVAGYYQVNVSVYPTGSAYGSFFVGLYKNGSAIAQGTGVAVQSGWGQSGVSSASTLVYLNGTTDNINCKLIGTSVTGTWQTAAGAAAYFQATWVHA
jgi:hypothetical protein